MSTQDDNDRGYNIVDGEPRRDWVAQLMWQTKSGEYIPPLWKAILITLPLAAAILL